MDISIFWRGLIIGFSIAAPVGPIGVLCIRRTLADGRTSGLMSGLGAATADACYGLIAAWGLTVVSRFLVDQQGWLRLIGGAYVCYLGYKTFRAKPGERSAEAPGRGLIGAYTSILFLTLTNPMTILSFAAIFAGLGAGAAGRGASGAPLIVIGVFAGSCAWWLILVSFTSRFRSKFTTAGLEWVNRISGAMIAAFGLSVLYGLITSVL